MGLGLNPTWAVGDVAPTYRIVVAAGTAPGGPSTVGAVTRAYALGRVTPRWPMYLPARSAYEVSQGSSDSRNKNWATPSLA